MARIDRVKEVLRECFGAASANQVDKWVGEGMSEAEVIAKARAKVSGLLGEDKARELDVL